MNIYIASSFRNMNAVLLLRDALTGMGHTVHDWTRHAPPVRNNMPMAERKALLDSDERGKIFEFCSGACGSVDLVVYLDPAGQDAACEVGIAWASGVPVFGVTSPLDAPGLVLNRCVGRWFDGFEPFFEAVQDMHCNLVNPE